MKEGTPHIIYILGLVTGMAIVIVYLLYLFLKYLFT